VHLSPGIASALRVQPSPPTCPHPRLAAKCSGNVFSCRPPGSRLILATAYFGSRAATTPPWAAYPLGHFNLKRA
jgi:hypothetical protein